MKVLIIGSGGREHALAWRISQSQSLTRLWVANGNAGSAQLATNLQISPEDIDAVLEASQSLKIDLVVVGPELPLSLGVADRLISAGIPVFGPSQQAAQLETSKSFARQVMRQSGVPGPDFQVFRDLQNALDFVSRHDSPVVVKADGLAAGKGVRLCRNSEEAASAVRACMDDRVFGIAGETVVIEELLTGPEISVFGFSDGERVSSLVAACDYKRLGDGNEGPNTGGMGSYTPPHWWNQKLAAEISYKVMQPTIEAMAQQGTPYRGVLYAGLMLTPSGSRVLEFNCRFGDPEAQVILPLLASDPLEVMLACCEGNLKRVSVKWKSDYHVGVVMASEGYPAQYETGYEITGLDKPSPDTIVFHAGTKLLSAAGYQRVTTSGGRVLTVVGRGATLAEARDKAYYRVRNIHFENAYYRTDIASI